LDCRNIQTHTYSSEFSSVSGTLDLSYWPRARHVRIAKARDERREPIGDRQNCCEFECIAIDRQQRWRHRSIHASMYSPYSMVNLC